ncbi:Tetratricopeptide repeat protein 25 [Mactra antiquata]
MYGEDNGSEGPRGTFEIYRAEADSLYKQGEYRKAIESYTLALELTPGEKNCLVCRSRCHLQLGDMQSALTDAEASLEEDKEFHKGIYQKAQAYYYQGDFEMALVFYHRGLKLRPEIQEFRLGIQKAQEAIDNSVGSPETVKLTTEGDLSYFDHLQDDKKIKRKTMTYGRPAAQQTKTVAQRVNIGSEKTIKQLLGELYGDRQYLEKLLKETDPKSEMGKSIATLVNDGLSYLDTRSDFWRQQKPMYARRHDRLMQRRKRESSSNKLAPNDYIIKELERIDQAQVEGRYQEALKRAQKCLSTVQGFSETDVPNKIEVIANLYSCIGNAYLEMGSYDKALESHKTDLSMGQTHDMVEAVSRGLDNIGRVHARKGEFAKAIEVWERKLPMSKSPLESTWLYHEIGRCYLELEQHEEAKTNGQQSESAAIEADDQMWHLQALVLTAQAEVKLGELIAAVATFEKASELAKAQGDKSAETAIKKAIDEINAKIISEGITETDETADKTDEEANNNAETEEPQEVTDTKENVEPDPKPEKQEEPPTEKTEPEPVKEEETKPNTNVDTDNTENVKDNKDTTEETTDEQKETI